MQVPTAGDGGVGGMHACVLSLKLAGLAQPVKYCPRWPGGGVV